MPPASSITRCSGCGAWDVDSGDKCSYCGSPVTYQQQGFSDLEVSLAKDETIANWIDNMRADLLKNLNFLREQLEITQHPSLNQKIANTKVKLEHLDKLEVKIAKPD